MPQTAQLDDCWNRIGVRGDRSCVRLASLHHCRHCPVHADAAHRIMQQRAPAGLADEWAAQHALPPTPQRTGGSSQMVFRIGREWLCLPTGLCLQVVDPAPVHVLPHRANPLLTGVVNVDGRLTPQVALGALLGVDGGADAAVNSGVYVGVNTDSAPGAAAQVADTAAARYVYPRLMLVQAGAHAVAVPVAELQGLARIHRDDMRPLPATVGKAMRHFLTGTVTVGAIAVGVLDGDLVAHHLAQALR